MNVKKPTRTVNATALGGALGIIVVWLISFIVDVPGEVAAAISTVMATLTGWFVKNG